jgi:type II secretory pathway component PulC
MINFKQYNWNNFTRNPFIPLVVAGLFLILSAWMVYQLIDSFKFTPPAMPAVVVQPPAPIPQVSNLHLFGMVEAQLHLTLQGTVVDVYDASKSHALIMSPGEPTKIYTVGEFVPGNAKVTKIESYGVILDNAGQLQRLNLPLKTLPTIKVPEDTDE